MLYETINNIFGVIYFISWSVGFYYQIYLMIKIKSGDGFSIDNQILANIGMLYYAIYNTYYVFCVHTTFASVLDMVYTFQGVILGLIILFLTFYYPREKNKINISLSVMIAIFLFLNLFYYYIGVVQKNSSYDHFMLFLGIGESWSCVVKYLYQIYLNIDKQSTIGFAIEGIIGDLSGAVFSFLQIVIDYYLIGTKDINFPKILLSFVSIAFDSFIIYQHYCLYPQKTKKFEKLDSNELQTEDLSDKAIKLSF